MLIDRREPGPCVYRQAVVRLVAVLILFVPAAGDASEFETQQTLSASDFLAGDMVQGPHHRVVEEVKNDTLFNHYEVESTYGRFSVSTNSGLKILIGEIAAIAEMKKVETDDTVVNSLKESGKSTVEGVKQLFSAPEETIEGAAAGIGSLFSRAKQTTGKRDVAETEDNRAKQLIGFSRSKGEIASTYGVNVYSRNEVLQRELERLAWADFAGGIGVGAARSALTGGVGGMLLSTSEAARLLNDVINTTPASELWVQNKNNLLAMEIPEDTVTLFLNNKVFSPALTTIIVKALEKMEGVENRELLVTVALQASTAAMAETITKIAVMTSGYHRHVAPLTRLVPMGRVTRAETHDGTPVILVPADYMAWTERVKDLLDPLADHTSGELWVTGTVSDAARSNLESSGWKLHDNAGEKLALKK